MTRYRRSDPHPESGRDWPILMLWAALAMLQGLAWYLVVVR